MQVAGAMRVCAGPGRCPSLDSLGGVKSPHLVARSTPKHALVRRHTLCRPVGPRRFAGGQLPVMPSSRAAAEAASWPTLRSDPRPARPGSAPSGGPPLPPRLLNSRQGPSWFQTVDGPVAADEPGVVLPHEHVVTDLRGPTMAGYGQADPEDVVRVMNPLLVEAKKQGVRRLIECKRQARYIYPQGRRSR
jgi:hypothetical protein